MSLLHPHKTTRPLAIAACLFLIGSITVAQKPSLLQKSFRSPPPAASPWVFWYWMNGAVSREGITADLEAMKQSGIGGAYLMPIKDTVSPALYTPAVRQLTPEWWSMVRHAVTEARRLQLQLAMHVSDGFALAGGPWITPELSMQKLVWTQTSVTGGKRFDDTLQQPSTLENYYRDVAVFAYPSPSGTGHSTQTIVPTITASKPDSAAQLLAQPGNKRNFNCDDQCWVQYSFGQPFTCRSVIIRSRNNYQANRLLVSVSDDGRTFRSVERLEAPRHGWQDWDSDYTHAIPAVTARYFRFTFDKSGSEPGAEDLDAAKWKPSLKITGIELSGEPKIHQYEGKNGEVWRVSKRSSEQQLPNNSCVPQHDLINITDKLDTNGRLVWDAPPGNWTILRMGHTSTGHRNDTGGGGKGLECDKFNPEAIRLQFDKWFGEALRQAGPEMAKDVLKVFHVDSWECGSQNWSRGFMDEFKKRRRYDLLPYLPVMAGVPVETAEVSERVLYDVRQTIAELVNDVFYGTLRILAHAKNAVFTAESVAPTMMSDGMLHYQMTDVPMGEFWFRSPTHDKPNDMLDAISGAHIYGKNIVQAEAFTELRMAWDEHPGLLKSLGDRNFALGINRLVFHVFTHNPWMNRKPGMTLDDVGLYFQRDQTWWKGARAWVDYVTRCQVLLQAGKPVTDLAVFTGEELPRRSLLPERLVTTLPGIIGAKRVAKEQERLLNKDQPLRQLPAGVTHSANLADPADWVDPLRGYAYDSYNKDALVRLSTIENGRIELPGGASYGILVLPASHPMVPDAGRISHESASKIRQLVMNGATVLICEKPGSSPGFYDHEAGDSNIQRIAGEFRSNPKAGDQHAATGVIKMGKGRIIRGAFTQDSFDELGIERDVMATEGQEHAEGIAWTHRRSAGLDIYFISNQQAKERTIELSLRVGGRIPELWNPLTGETDQAGTWRSEEGRTVLPVQLAAHGSLFIVFQTPSEKTAEKSYTNWMEPERVATITGPWSVQFDTLYKGPASPVVFDALQDWSKHSDTAVRHYSGTAIYNTSFEWKSNSSRVWLNLGKVANMAEVKINNTPCGIAWTPPYRLDITKALREGMNTLQIEVTNTWANRLIGDLALQQEARLTKTTAPLRLLQPKSGRTLLEAGLLGPVVIEVSRK